MSRVPTRNGRLLRWRGKLGVCLLAVVRRLLDVHPSDGDFDTCVYCRARGCESGEVRHAADCPTLTLLFPVTLCDLWPDGPSLCMSCGSAFWPGDHYTHRPAAEDALAFGALAPLVGECVEDVFEVVCLGCAAHDALTTRGGDE